MEKLKNDEIIKKLNNSIEEIEIFKIKNIKMKNKIDNYKKSYQNIYEEYERIFELMKDSEKFDNIKKINFEFDLFNSDDFENNFSNKFDFKSQTTKNKSLFSLFFYISFNTI